MRACLVAAAVFKIVGPYANRAVGGFDSHALPLLILAMQDHLRVQAKPDCSLCFGIIIAFTRVAIYFQ